MMRPDPDRAPISGRIPHRATDLVEDAASWLLTAAALLLIVIAGVVGLAVYRQGLERADLQSRTKSQTSAVLLEDTHVVPEQSGRHRAAQVHVHWTDRDGGEHYGVMQVTRSMPAGAGVDVWIDTAGEITSQPLRPADAVICAIGAAFGVLWAGAALLVLAWLGIRHVTQRYNSRRWEQEWEQVEPRWRHTTW